MTSWRSICAAALGVALLASGCGGGGGPSGAGGTSGAAAGAPTVYFIFNGYTPPYFAPMAQGIQDAAKQLGDLNIKIIGANGSASDEISDINSAVAAGAKGIILNAIDTSVTQAASQATHQGVPVVTIDRDVSDPAARFAFIGDNDRQLGNQETTSCLRGIQDAHLPQPWNVVVLQGTLGATTATDRLAGTMDALKPATDNGSVHIALNQSADFDTGKAQALMSSFLAKTPNVQAVIAGNDAMALGAITALNGAGQTPGTKTIVCGVDAQPESLDAIKAGTQYNTVTHSPYLEAFWAAQAMDKYLKSKTTPPADKFPNGNVLIPQEVVTKANVGQVSAWGTPASLPPLPY